MKRGRPRIPEGTRRGDMVRLLGKWIYQPRVAKPEPRRPRAPRRPKVFATPIPADMHIPAPACLGPDDFQPETRRYDLAIPLHRIDVETLRDCYLQPPCTELPTFFPNHP